MPMHSNDTPDKLSGDETTQHITQKQIVNGTRPDFSDFLKKINDPNEHTRRPDLGAGNPGATCPSSLNLVLAD